MSVLYHQSCSNMSGSVSFTPEEKYDLITRNLQETLGGDHLKKLLAEGKDLKCYWGKWPIRVLGPFASRADRRFRCLGNLRNCPDWST